METNRFINTWPWGKEITHVCKDGLGYVSLTFEKGYDFCFIHDLVVHESVRKRGRGQALLDLAEKEAIDSFGKKATSLRVIPSSWMKEWYERNGYTEWEDSPYGSVKGYVEMRKELPVTFNKIAEEYIAGCKTCREVSDAEEHGVISFACSLDSEAFYKKMLTEND